MSTAGRFCHIQKLGEGTYGCVYQANEKDTGRVVAFKRMVITNQDEGVPGTAIREICLLKELRHDNVVSLYEVLFDSPKITLVFELCDCDMKQYLETRCPTSRLDPVTEVRPVLKQMFAGLYYMHSRSVVHRDLKPQNVFFNIRPRKHLSLEGVWGAAPTSVPGGVSSSSTGGGQHLTGSSAGPFTMNGSGIPETHELVVKLGDFGLARVENIPVKKYSHEVVTLWYRSPDVLMGSALYSFPVDVWSMGTIFFEMVTGRVLFGGRNEDDQMVRMMRLLGSPTKETWPSMRTYPGTNDRLERASAFVTQQRQEERARKARLAAAGAANAAASGSGSGANGGGGASRRRGNQASTQAAVPGQAGTTFSYTEFCLEREDEATLMNNLNTSRSSANSLRLPSELWFPNPLFDEFMSVSGFRGAVGEEGVDLLRQCLQYEPSRRVTAAEVLNHPFLRNVRVPTMLFLDEISSQLSQTLELAGL